VAYDISKWIAGDGMTANQVRGMTFTLTGILLTGTNL